MTSNTERLDQAVERWNAGDLDGYLDLYDASIRLHGYAPEPMDKPAVAGFYAMVCETLGAGDGGPPRLAIDDVIAEGDRLAARFTMSGVHRGPFMGIPATGRDVRLAGITILRFADGRVVERWSQADMLGLLVQIGAVPPPG